MNVDTESLANLFILALASRCLLFASGAVSRIRSLAYGITFDRYDPPAYEKTLQLQGPKFDAFVRRLEYELEDGRFRRRIGNHRFRWFKKPMTLEFKWENPNAFRIPHDMELQTLRVSGKSRSKTQ